MVVLNKIQQIKILEFETVFIDFLNVVLLKEKLQAKYSCITFRVQKF